MELDKAAVLRTLRNVSGAGVGLAITVYLAACAIASSWWPGDWILVLIGAAGVMILYWLTLEIVLTWVKRSPGQVQHPAAVTITNPGRTPGYYRAAHGFEASKSIRDGTWRVRYASNGAEAGSVTPSDRGLFAVVFEGEHMGDVGDVDQALELMRDARDAL